MALENKKEIYEAGSIRSIVFRGMMLNLAARREPSGDVAIDVVDLDRPTGKPLSGGPLWATHANFGYWAGGLRCAVPRPCGSETVPFREMSQAVRC